MNEYHNVVCVCGTPLLLLLTVTCSTYMYRTVITLFREKNHPRYLQILLLLQGTFYFTTSTSTTTTVTPTDYY
jgi:hypothetical protein